MDEQKTTPHPSHVSDGEGPVEERETTSQPLLRTELGYGNPVRACKCYKPRQNMIAGTSSAFEIRS